MGFSSCDMQSTLTFTLIESLVLLFLDGFTGINGVVVVVEVVEALSCSCLIRIGVLCLDRFVDFFIDDTDDDDDNDADDDEFNILSFFSV